MKGTAKTKACAMIAMIPLTCQIAVAEEQSAKVKGNLPPIIDHLLSFGTELTYLGNAGGVKGYLGKSQEGRFQTFYVMPDGKHLIAGIMSDSRGVNVTGVQIGEMQERFKEAQKLAADGTHPPIANGFPVAETLENEKHVAPDSPDRSLNAGYSGNAKGSTESEFAVQANQTGFVEVGSVSAPVAVWMLADPNCEFCHTAWSQLKKFIDAGKIRVRIIPVAFLPGSRKDAVNLLSSNDPVGAWTGSEGGRLRIPESGAENASLRNAEETLRKNMKFAEDSGINGTPFLAFEDEKGSLQTSRGVPKEMERFLGLELR